MTQQNTLPFGQVVPSPVISDPRAHQNRTTSGGIAVLLAGDIGTWKTTWASEWPGVLFISLVAERGDTSLLEYPKIAQVLLKATKLEIPPVFNAGQPIVWPVKTVKEYRDALEAVRINHRAWGVRTVVTDSVTYLTELWQYELMQERYKNAYWREKFDKGEEVITMRDWGALGNFLMNSRIKLTSEGLNVLWIGLTKEYFKTDPKTQDRTLDRVEVMIPGRNQQLLAGACDLHIYAEKKWVAHQTAIGRQIMQPIYWVASNPKVQWVRHRFGYRFPAGKLQDPEWGDIPTFRALWVALQDHIYVG